jgi:hypothetical protein
MHQGEAVPPSVGRAGRHGPAEQTEGRGKPALHLDLRARPEDNLEPPPSPGQGDRSSGSVKAVQVGIRSFREPRPDRNMARRPPPPHGPSCSGIRTLLLCSGRSGGRVRSTPPGRFPLDRERNSSL